ncbi:MAG: sodium transporter [Verrucomicrobia bacterium]|nr:MAG: sodium transporter [Verrucomicrobiota bacterium]
MTFLAQSASLNTLDLSIFGFYMLATVALGFWVARHARSKPTDYFLGERKLPWYVVGASMIAADISSETFIANVGIAYLYGMASGTTGWQAWITYSILMVVFLPYYVRTGLYTMPQFLERRYNTACRYLFSASLVVGYIVALMAGSLYAGGLALQSIFGLDIAATQAGNIRWAIVFFAVVTGAYTIYGGLKSAAWTDFFQMLVLLTAGILMPVLAVHKAGGLVELAKEYPEKFHVFLPPTNPQFPWTGVFTAFITVGLWYNCASQHMVQRVLAARNEWHARMGVVAAGFLRIVTPLMFVLPGIAAYKLFPELETQHKVDHAYLLLVKTLIPVGLKGLVLAGMAAALMSHVSTVLNSTATLLTMDFYKQLLRPTAGDREQVIFGQVIGTCALIASVWVSFYFIASPEALFRLVQRIFFWIAPPFAVVFLLGLLWRRANATAAVVTILSGFAFRAVLEFVILERVPALRAYKAAYQHGAIVTWTWCVAVMAAVSLATAPPAEEKTAGIIWNRSYLSLLPEERAKYTGAKDFRIWWAVFVLGILAIYAFFFWFQFVRRSQ